jgi:hypothetical protein
MSRGCSTISNTKIGTSVAKCNFNQCELDVFGDEDKCILHCKKNEYSEDFKKTGFLSSFKTELIKYTIDFIYKGIHENRMPTEESVKKFLAGNIDGNIDTVLNFLKNQIVLLDHIFFPDRNSQDSFDYKSVLEKIGNLRFTCCEFFVFSLDLKSTKLFFQNCKFHRQWYLYDHQIYKNDNNVLYQMCEFEEEVCAGSEGNKNQELKDSIFCDCQFKKSIMINDLKLKGRLFRNTNKFSAMVQNIEINGCTFEDKCILNNFNINTFRCYDSNFKNKLEFKENKVNLFEIHNTNFNKLVDCYNTTFIKFQIKKSIFEDFVNFENCTFGLDGASEQNEYKAVFLYATMMSFINFRHASFRSGLDLEHINLKEPPNFLNATIFSSNTNRETFRIIKHSFDRIGNYIEANKFYEMEMLKYKEELKNKKKYSTYLLLRLYELTSHYGQSYIRPILFTLLTAIVYCFLILGYEKNVLYSIYPTLNGTIEIISNFLNGISRHILPLNKVLKEGMEFISLVAYILFTSFIWLIILAIKRSTKR